MTINEAVELASILIATIAAGAACWSAHLTRKATEGQFLKALFDDYAREDILDGMLNLHRWKAEHGNEFSEEFRKRRQKDYESVRVQDEARRRLSHHFQKIYALKNVGVIRDRVVMALATKVQVRFYREVIEPLEEALNPSYDTDSFEYLGGLYGIGKCSRPMPNPEK